MTQASTGDTVRIHYTGLFPDRTEFDSTRGRAPLEFALGSDAHFPGLHRAVTGMTVGQTKTVTIPAPQAYGLHDPQKVDVLPRAKLPAHIHLAPGVQLNAERADGTPMPVTITKVTDESVTLDANHPLAGRDLIFEIELVGLN